MCPVRKAENSTFQIKRILYRNWVIGLSEACKGILKSWRALSLKRAGRVKKMWQGSQNGNLSKRAPQGCDLGLWGQGTAQWLLRSQSSHSLCQESCSTAATVASSDARSKPGAPSAYKHLARGANCATRITVIRTAKKGSSPFPVFRSLWQKL